MREKNIKVANTKTAKTAKIHKMKELLKKTILWVSRGKNGLKFASLKPIRKITFPIDTSKLKQRNALSGTLLYIGGKKKFQMTDQA